MPAVAASQVENAFDLPLDLKSIVGQSLLNQARAEANDVLIRVPHGHEILAINRIPIFVFSHLLRGPISRSFRYPLVTQVFIKQIWINRRCRQQVSNTFAGMSVSEGIRAVSNPVANLFALENGLHCINNLLLSTVDKKDVLD